MSCSFVYERSSYTLNVNYHFWMQYRPVRFPYHPDWPLKLLPLICMKGLHLWPLLTVNVVAVTFKGVWQVKSEGTNLCQGLRDLHDPQRRLPV